MNATEELVELLENEQLYLWGDLSNDLRMASNGYWSIGAENRIQRICWIAKAIGVTHPGDIQLPLLASGVYQEVCRKLGQPGVGPEFAKDYPEHSRYPEVWMTHTLPKIRELELEEM